jgi:uncharacterized protein
VVLEPEPDNKAVLLRELTGSYLKRDVLEANIRDQDKFHHLAQIMAQQTGALVNRNELSRVLNLSVTAIENYLHTLQICFHLALVRPFAQNIRKELTRMPKVYFHDLGFRNTLLGSMAPVSSRPDQGAVAENYAYIRLRSLYGTDPIRFWRTADGHEVDFVVGRSPAAGIAIEVKTNYSKYNPSQYSKFSTTYPNYPLHCRALSAPENSNALIAL